MIDSGRMKGSFSLLRCTAGDSATRLVSSLLISFAPGKAADSCKKMLFDRTLHVDVGSCSFFFEQHSSFGMEPKFLKLFEFEMMVGIKI